MFLFSEQVQAMKGEILEAVGTLRDVYKARYSCDKQLHQWRPFLSKKISSKLESLKGCNLRDKIWGSNAMLTMDVATPTCKSVMHVVASMVAGRLDGAVERLRVFLADLS